MVITVMILTSIFLGRTWRLRMQSWVMSSLPRTQNSSHSAYSVVEYALAFSLTSHVPTQQCPATGNKRKMILLSVFW